MPNARPMPESLLDPIYEILQQHAQGLSEYDLMRALAQQEPYFDQAHSSPLALFRQHFLLYHSLYLLQNKLFAEAHASLRISALQIQLSPYAQGQQALCESDPVRDYYLDFNNLENTDETEVAALLGQFWRALACSDSRAAALALLQLQDPVDDKRIRQRYRELVMKNHPDRGGDTQTLQELNEAIKQLLPRGH